MGERTPLALREVGLGLLAVGAALVGLSCGEGDITEPTTSTLEVITSTTGLEPDANGYTVQIDAEITQALGPSETVRTTDIATGNHTVQLGGVAANCTVAGENPRAVSISAGGTTTVTFQVSCSATTGSLQISSSTRGPSPDADGYVISLDGTDRGTLGQSAEVTLGGLTPGDHLLGLSGVTGNCQVQGDNPQSLNFTAGESATAAFEVACTVPPPNAGTLRLTTTTTGTDPDPDGYEFTVESDASQPIGLNATATLDNMAAGAHLVLLSGVAENCALEGANPRTTTVSTEATADVSFAIACSATTGTIQVIVTTSGTAPDPDGYLIQLDDGAQEQPIATNGAASFAKVPAGNHTVTLSDVTANCSVADGTSGSITVTVGAGSEISFVVTCAARTGSIQVTAPTSGSSLDLDGYTVFLGREAIAIERDGSHTFGGLAPGSHRIALDGLSTNCRTNEENPRDVTVTAGATATIAFVVSCSPQLVFASDIDNSSALKIYIMNADGTDVVQLTQEGNDVEPICSPDGSKIAFLRHPPGSQNSEQIFVMNADGSGQTRLTTRRARDLRWSPDGSKIAFADYGDREIYVINADGSGLTNLTNNAGFDENPAWSPDGTKIAFDRSFESTLIVDGTPVGRVYQILVMNADGSGQTRLTNNEKFDTSPIWSPDGRRILFNRGVILNAQIVIWDVWTMTADGSNQTNLTNNPLAGSWQGASGGAWSLDGSKIAFSSDSLETGFINDIYVMNADGTGRTNLTHSPAEFEDGPKWSPDGSKIAFGRSVNNKSAIFVMNPDGTGRMNLMLAAVSAVWRP